MIRQNIFFPLYFIMKWNEIFTVLVCNRKQLKMSLKIKFTCLICFKIFKKTLYISMRMHSLWWSSSRQRSAQVNNVNRMPKMQNWIQYSKNWVQTKQVHRRDFERRLSFERLRKILKPSHLTNNWRFISNVPRIRRENILAETGGVRTFRWDQTQDWHSSRRGQHMNWRFVHGNDRIE